VDVRSAAEFRAAHVPGAHNVPLDEIEDEIEAEVTDKETTLYLIYT